MPARDPRVDQTVGIKWMSNGSPGKAPTKNCRHSTEPDRLDTAAMRKLSRTHRQVQCPHCGLWALWVLK
jgi:hypothetical protein